MLVSKIKPCMSKYKHLYCETANGSLNQLSFYVIAIKKLLMNSHLGSNILRPLMTIGFAFRRLIAVFWHANERQLCTYISP